MIYAVYKIFQEEPNKGYYWGKWTDPINLAYACFNMADTGVDDIKIIEVPEGRYIPTVLEW